MKYYILLIILSPLMSTQFIIGAILGGIGGLIGLGTGIANTVSNVQTANTNNQISQEQNQLAKDSFNFNKEQALWNRDFANKNFDLQNRIFGYQQQQNDLMREREDNAVQRRAKDLEAAGLSKTLAAGSAASAGGTSAGVGSVSGASGNVSAPQLSKREAWRLENLNAIATSLEFMNAFEDIKNKRSQNNVNNARVGEILSNAGLLNEKQKTELVNRLVGNSVANLNNSKTATEDYNREYSKNKNMRTTDSTMGVYNTMKDLGSDIIDTFNNQSGKPKEPDFNSSPRIKVGDKSELNKRYRNMASDYISKGNMNNLLNDFVKSNYDYIPGSSWREKTRWVLNNLNYN